MADHRLGDGSVVGGDKNRAHVLGLLRPDIRPDLSFTVLVGRERRINLIIVRTIMGIPRIAVNGLPGKTNLIPARFPSSKWQTLAWKSCRRISRGNHNDGLIVYDRIVDLLCIVSRRIGYVAYR